MSDTTPRCGHCGAPCPDAYLCPGATAALAAALTGVPGWLDELRHTRWSGTITAPTGGVPCPDHGTQDCTCGTRLPWGEQAAAVEADLRNSLTTWVRALLTEAGAVQYVGGDTASLARWLARYVASIAQREWAIDCHADLMRLLHPDTGRVVRAVDVPEALAYHGPCGATTDSGICAAQLYARAGRDEIRCRACGATWTVAERTVVMVDYARDVTGTAVEVAAWLTKILRRRVPASTIRAAAHDGRLAGHGGRYRVGDVYDLVTRDKRDGQS